MRLVIDASNIRAGGGIVYLQNLLKYADPQIHEFKVGDIVSINHKSVNPKTQFKIVK